MDYFATFGRFHMVFLHMPIGLIAGVVALEVLSMRRGAPALRDAVRVMMWLSALSAVVVAGMGYVLSLQGYTGSTVFWHMWLGFGVAAASVATLALHEWAVRAAGDAGVARRRLLAFRVGLVVMMGLVVPAGHLGGTLTHGENFLFAKVGEGAKPVKVGEHATELTAFAKSVRPVLETYCYSCHGEQKQKGGLALHTVEDILAGGKHGPVVVAGDAEGSELLVRLRLPLEDEDHMPPDGKPQPTEEQIQGIEEWIRSGAALDGAARVGLKEVVPAGVAPPHSAADVVPRAASAVALEALRAALVHVQEVAPESPLLWIDFAAPSGAGLVSDARVEELLRPVAANVQDLSLARSGVTDRSAALLAGMTRLRRLDLSRTAITDAGVAALGGMNVLEELNLVGTGVSDRSVEVLATAPVLRKVFLWSTKVTPEGVERLRAARPGLMIETGSALEGRTLEVEEPPKVTKGTPVVAPPASAGATLRPVNMKCPVTGEPVDSQFVIVYEGKCIGFCCAKCPAKFWDDPAKYVKMLE